MGISSDVFWGKAVKELIVSGMHSNRLTQQCANVSVIFLSGRLDLDELFHSYLEVCKCVILGTGELPYIGKLQNPTMSFNQPNLFVNLVLSER
jgi:hypothetical protein